MSTFKYKNVPANSWNSQQWLTILAMCLRTRGNFVQLSPSLLNQFVVIPYSDSDIDNSPLYSVGCEVLGASSSTARVNYRIMRLSQVLTSTTSYTSAPSQINAKSTCWKDAYPVKYWPSGWKRSEDTGLGLFPLHEMLRMKNTGQPVQYVTN